MKSSQAYNPTIRKTMPWDKIEQYYVNLISHGFELESMLSLVKHIKKDYPEGRLFGYIYLLEKLAVTIYNPAEWHRENLHIEFNRNNRRWHFEYFPKPFEPSEHEKYYDEPEGIEKFDQFINWLKW